jgi:hypothetical protein
MHKFGQMVNGEYLVALLNSGMKTRVGSWELGAKSAVLGFPPNKKRRK